ncbi:hypothetical protein FHN55_10495 [Streptomyces sp. NP160]|uniref:DUF6636 domain-containing protein n=1 Tax=Streptomyces sp. NP160 TaxID=2586637 RepID=UPI001118BCAC|nr:DUF6636 domain-containing protein [Streptomyces sp. NP160]TNM67469.1 hypothetical protein FHN55_10495 [Streptomyces sp. NP160]
MTGRTPTARRTRAAAALAGVLLLGGLLAGCSGSEEPEDGGAASGASAAPPPSSSAGPAGPAASGSPSAAVVTSMTTFRSPTGNISCYLAPVQGADPYARCDLAEQRWDVREPEGGCDDTWGGGGGSYGSVGVGGGDAEPLCVGDTIADPSAPTLAYGSSITMEPLTCTSVSDKVGMTCENSTTGHGFTVRKEKVELF